MEVMINGKLAVLDIEESGKQICQKLFFLLDRNQQNELIQFIMQNQRGISLDDNLLPSLQFKNSIFTEIKKDNLYLCLEQHLVRVYDCEIALTIKEFDILALLMKYPKRVFTYEMITEIVWQEEYAFYSRKAISNHVSNLRKKLKIFPDSPDYIKSVYGIGYKFDP